MSEQILLPVSLNRAGWHFETNDRLQLVETK